MNRIFLLVLVGIVVLVLFVRYVIIPSLDGYKIIGWWNRQILQTRNEQNSKYHMCAADTSNVSAARKLNRLIKENHNQILQEVMSLMSRGYTGLPMAEMDEHQHRLTEGRDLWSPIWIKFIDTWAGSAKNVPTLTRIVKEVGDDILLLHVSVFKPGAYLPYHKGISMGVWRYHYGLQIPDGDVGLEIDGYRHDWRNGYGFIWDDTIPHSAWNRSEEPRLVIFADIHRNMGSISKSISKYVHRVIQSTKHIKSIQEKLAKTGIRVD